VQGIPVLAHFLVPIKISFNGAIPEIDLGIHLFNSNFNQISSFSIRSPILNDFFSIQVKAYALSNYYHQGYDVKKLFLELTSLVIMAYLCESSAI
jgi:hypothetical protein